jgi:hypothetical protein
MIAAPRAPAGRARRRGTSRSGSAPARRCTARPACARDTTGRTPATEKARLMPRRPRRPRLADRSRPKPTWTSALAEASARLRPEPRDREVEEGEVHEHVRIVEGEVAVRDGHLVTVRVVVDLRERMREAEEPRPHEVEHRHPIMSVHVSRAPSSARGSGFAQRYGKCPGRAAGERVSPCRWPRRWRASHFLEPPLSGCGTSPRLAEQDGTQRRRCVMSSRYVTIGAPISA